MNPKNNNPALYQDPGLRQINRICWLDYYFQETSIASAHNLAPRWLQWLANLLQNAVRSVPSIILGLIFVAATGLGASAGTLALGIYTVGYLAKFYQEAIESVDIRSIESLLRCRRIQNANCSVWHSASRDVS